MAVIAEVKRLAKFGHAPHCTGGSDDCNLCNSMERYARSAYTEAMEKAAALVEKAHASA